MSANNVIDQLKRDELVLRKKIDAIRKSVPKLAEAEADLECLLGTIKFYERGNAANRLDEIVREVLVPPLTGLTHKQAVLSIARANGGKIYSQEAKRLMVRAGVMRDTKNASRMVHNAIKGTNRFTYISPGEYKLNEDKNTTTPLGLQINQLQ